MTLLSNYMSDSTYTTSKTGYCNFWCENGINYLLSMAHLKTRLCFVVWPWSTLIPIHFSGLAALMSADIARNLWSLVCSCLNSYCTFFIFFPLLIFLEICCFLHWIQSVNPHFYVTLYYNGSPYICDSWVGYSAGGYSLSPRWLLT